MSKTYNVFDQNTISIDMSKEYSRIAQENYILYTEKLDRLNIATKKVTGNMAKVMEMAYHEMIESNSLPLEIAKYDFLYDEVSSKTDLMKNNMEEFVEVTKLIQDAVMSTNIAQTTDIDTDVSELDFDVNAIIRYGVITLAFEGFACEALLNQEMLKHMTRSQLKKYKSKDKIPAYISKFRYLIDERNIAGDLSTLEEKFVSLMRNRNNIAHFTEYEYSMEAMFHRMEDFYDDVEGQDFYIGEIFEDLENLVGVNNEIRSFIDTSNANDETSINTIPESSSSGKS
jgi:hypothetical protein